MAKADRDALCPATLVHNHGTATCRHAPGHTGKHLGTCEGCWEDGEDSDLSWTELYENWRVPVGHPDRVKTGDP